MPYTTVKGEKVYYQTSEGGTVPVVYVHGAGGSSQKWSGQLSGLPSTTGYAVDLPGHGKSGGQLLNNIGDLADFIGDFADSLALEHFVLCGHSMGGAIALEFTLRYPERLLGLVLVGTGARLRVSPDILGALERGKLPFTNANHLYGSNASTQVLASALEEIQQVGSEIYLADFSACNRFDRVDSIQMIRVPALILVGDEDVMTPVKYSQYLTTHIENSQLMVIEGTGHICMQEKPEVVTKAIAEFVKTLAVPAV